MVPDSLGSVKVCADVAAEVRVLNIFVGPAIPRSPLLRITNFVAPELEAVKRSPTPELSTISAANDVVPEMDATGRVPILPLTSSAASGEVAPIPRLPVVSMVSATPDT